MSVAPPVTILVHGVWMHGIVMELLRHHLNGSGFDARCYSYSSVAPTLTENAQQLAHYALALNAPQIHWVGHSLGGLVILHMLESTPALPPGRLVLLGTPFQGSYAARALGSHDLGAMAMGHSLAEWFGRDKPAGFPQREIGVIAGSHQFGLGMFVAPTLPEPNDGVVAVAETVLPGMRDSIVLPVSHSGMLFSRDVSVQTAAFLHNGSFDHAAAAT